MLWEGLLCANVGVCVFVCVRCQCPCKNCESSVLRAMARQTHDSPASFFIFSLSRLLSLLTSTRPTTTTTTTTITNIQSCCNSHWAGIGDGDNGAVSFQRDLHFPGVLDSAESEGYLACRQAWYDKTVAYYGKTYVDRQFPEWVPDTYPGSCNMFGCHCDHCYADEDCQGTNDGDPNDQADRWKLSVGDEIDHRRYDGYITQDCPVLKSFRVKGYTGVCAAGAGSASVPSTVKDAARACADRDAVLSEPLPQLAARLSSYYCANEEDSVGLEFAGSLLASLDADKSDSVSCAEWGIAKFSATLQQLGGGYLGTPKLEAPRCKLSTKGKESIARYNAYLGKLTLATALTNATALAATSASRAVITIENDVGAGSVAGALLGARDKVAAAWNATRSR